MTAYSVDHQLLCLPFIPVFRNQDGLFTRMCRCCCPEVLFGHATTVVKHDNATKGDRARPFTTVAAIRVVDLIEAFIPGAPNPELGPLQPVSLVTLGGYLRSVSRMPDHDLQDYLAYQARLKLSSIYQLWHQLLTSGTEFTTVKDDLASGLKVLQAAMVSPNCWIPIDRPSWVTDRKSVV